MAMHRRTLVKCVAGTSAAGILAGCISTEEPDPSEDDDETDTNGGNGGSEEYEEDEEWPTVEPEDGVDGEAELWYDLPEGEAALFTGNLEEFNDDHEPTIAADAVAELLDTTTAAIPAREGPELFLWAHDWVGEYYENGWLSDQSADLRIDLEEYFGEAADAVQYDGATLGLPYASETVSMIVNTDLVDDVPETFDEMQAIMEEHHDPESGTYGLSHNFDPYFYSSWVHGFGGYYYDDDTGDVGLTTEGAIEGFEFIRDELYPYMAADWEFEAQSSVFLEGNAPIAFNGPWYLGDLPDDMNYEVAPFPEVDGNTPSPYTGIQVIYFATEMDEDDDRAAAARSFAEWYCTNTSIINQMAQEQGYIPVHNAFVEDDEADDLPDDMQAFAEAVEQGIPMPTSPEMQDVWEPVGDAFVEVLNDDRSVEDAMADAEDRIYDAWD